MEKPRGWIQAPGINIFGLRLNEFPSFVGTSQHPSNLRIDFNRTLEAAGLPKIRFHDLRHTAASLMQNHGVPVIVVSKILGHAKPSTTMDIYGHLIHEMQEEAARIMDELVTPIRLEISEAVENMPPQGRLRIQLHPIAPVAPGK